ncbi:MAG: radical SAM protein [Ignavibacteria bacterium]|nr:radical SAM protein [Ignavibacteria bacterium]MBT8382366.1 radical SAM protein [Ignavibacteria bacterium]MBT8390959.1 radical SAM protein [Ignavibacteria bacterium]NNJ52711.1 radical SAM protein [Ignavibacteriaceae bacterium]NNL21568.1 radical SAM protein [Ignavibacteriaceae bacterium]
MPRRQHFSTIDFHVTCECNQECPYCWGPHDIENPVKTFIAKKIIDKVKEVGARRIVFTGGDPLKRNDAGKLIRHAKTIGLEVALSTTGDELTTAFLRWNAHYIDLISLPIDGSTEEVNSKTKEKNHLEAVMKALRLLKKYPKIDVKICTPVTKHNISDVPNILKVAEEYKSSTKASVFYNIFQTFPRSQNEVDWKKLVVSNREFGVLKRKLSGRKTIRVNFLDHKTLDKLYLMIFPDGNVVIPEGDNFTSFGPFLKLDDLNDIIKRSKFDSQKHLKHSKGWGNRISAKASIH